jgi:Spy/CpxP family protein refolding chaperone
MNKRLIVSVLVFAANVAIAGAHGPSGGPDPRMEGHPHGPWGGPPLEHNLFPPEFVLQNQDSLALTDDQVSAIKKEIDATHARVDPAHQSLRALAEQLHALLAKPQVDEAAALALASQTMDLEKAIKTAHMGMMIRVKNLLTAEQQDQLQKMRPQHPMGPMPPPDQN